MSENKELGTRPLLISGLILGGLIGGPIAALGLSAIGTMFDILNGQKVTLQSSNITSLIDGVSGEDIQNWTKKGFLKASGKKYDEEQICRIYLLNELHDIIGLPKLKQIFDVLINNEDSRFISNKQLTLLYIVCIKEIAEKNLSIDIFEKNVIDPNINQFLKEQKMVISTPNKKKLIQGLLIMLIAYKERLIRNQWQKIYLETYQPIEDESST
jgi:hypothetical protein